MSRLTVITGGQFGSEGKGAACAYLARDSDARQVAVIRVAGPNAGHTAYDDEGRKWALRQVPVAAVRKDAMLVIAPGSEIDPKVLRAEVTALDAAGLNVSERLYIDSEATILTPEHIAAEAGLSGRIGSTGKGIGAARAERLMRRAGRVADYPDAVAGCGTVMSRTNLAMRSLLQGDGHVFIEGTQGYGLGLHAGHYPQCTSSDCRAIDFLAMAGIDPAWAAHYEPWVVLRTYPIRVAGNSGPLLGETSWEALGLPEEFTTVTQKTRRVGEWDGDLASLAVLENGGPDVVRVALTMADQKIKSLWGKTSMMDLTLPDLDDLEDLLSEVEHDTGVRPTLVGTSPTTMLRMI